MPAWSRDAAKLAYTAPKEGSPGTEIKYLPARLSGGWVLGGSSTEPGWAPDGVHLVFGGDFIRWWEPGDPDTLRDAAPGSLAEPDWQPCVAGVTVSCVSVTPPPPPFRCPDATASAVAGHAISLPNLCPGAGWPRDPRAAAARHGRHGPRRAGLPPVLDVQRDRGHPLPRPALQPRQRRADADRDAHDRRRAGAGGAEADRARQAAARPARARAAPRALRSRCARLSLRLRSRLHTGKVVQGRIVKHVSAAGAPFSLRLARGTIPARRRVVGVRIAGTLTGADGLKRNFTLTLR